MTPKPVVARPGDDALASLQRMRSLRIRHLPVIDDGGELVGIISDRDLLSGVGRLRTDRARASAAAPRRVRELMTREVKVVAPDDTLHVAVRLFLEHRFGALPVVDRGGLLVGILSLIDVFRAWHELSNAGLRRTSARE